MKKLHQRRSRKLAKRKQPKARGRGGRTGIAANAWRAKPESSNDATALATMLALNATPTNTGN